jgi:putative phosphoesterase
MRLGVIADTHGLLRPEVFQAFARVDHIVHAGDIGPLDLLVELEALAPVTAVYGNTDGQEVRRRLPQVASVELEGFDVVVTHGDQLGSPTPERLNAAFPQAQIIIYGHTHRPLLTVVDVVVTVMNPGGAGHRRFGLPPSVGILELEPGIPPRGRLLPLLDIETESC